MSSYRKDLAALAKKYGFKILGTKNNGHLLLGNGERTVTASYSPRSARWTLVKVEKLLRGQA